MQTLRAPRPDGHYGRRGYGYGLDVTPDFLGRKMVGHGGSDGTWAWMAPKLQLIVLVFTQTQGRSTLRTKFFAFDTAITDLTTHLHDPVEVLFGVQLGGGTDIAHALAFCRRQIERPRETVLFLVTDLFEGGNAELMHRRVGELVASGVHVVVLLALSDDGAPAHDHEHATALRALGATVMATTPDEFPGVLADALAG